MSELREHNAAGRHRKGGRARWTRVRAAKLLRLSTSSKVKFGRIRAITWLAVGLISFPLGWANSVVLVWIASFYANAESGFATSEAANDEAVLEQIRLLREQVTRIERLMNAQTPASST